MDDAITPEILELILRTSRVRGFRDLYSLAPRGHRVGLYFQQLRAYLLAAAIRSRLGVGTLKSCRVGVVGGGASGLTFLLAIKAAGVQTAHLFEATKAPFPRGAKTRHRVLHPAYNRWPLLRSMDVFTSLPKLNWHAGSADDVMKQLTEGLGKDRRDLETDHVKYGCTVKSISQIGSVGKPTFKLTYEQKRIIKDASYDFVVVATGFGDETSASWSMNGYWSEHEEDFDVGTHTRPCTVYGTGDGGLIDLVCACAKEPAKAWEIPLGTIARLRPDSATAISREPGGTSVQLFTEFEKQIQAHEEDIRCMAWAVSRADSVALDRYATEEQDFYIGCIRELERDKPSILRYLDERFKAIAPRDRRPVLVGTNVCGFESTSAPVNKLLLAYLLHTKRIRYTRRDRSKIKAELDHLRGLRPAQRSRAVTICRFGARRNFPLDDGDSAPTGGIKVDIQGHSPIKETKTETQLIDALSAVTGGEYVHFASMPDARTQALFGMDPAKLSMATRRANKPVIFGFARTYLMASTVELQPEMDGSVAKWVIMTPLSDDEITEALRNMGGIDGSFLGLPITVSDQPSIMEQS